MFSLIRRYNFIFSLLLVSIFSISFLAKDVHEIFVKHQHVSCSDQPDSSFTHFHTTEHSLDNCLICHFVMAPVLGISHSIPELTEQHFSAVYNPYIPGALFNSTLFAYPLRGPPVVG